MSVNANKRRVWAKRILSKDLRKKELDMLCISGYELIEFS